MPYIFRLVSEPEGTPILNLDVEESWSPTVSLDGRDVVETIPVRITGATDNAQGANLQALHRIQENVRYYVNEPSSWYRQETWLEWQMLDESSIYAPRRRLVKAMDVAFDQGMWFTCGSGNVAREMRVVLTLRTAGWWESSLSQSPTDTVLDTTLMEPIAITPFLHGDAPGRLDYMRISERAGAGVASIWGAYVGFRSAKRHGTLANFVPLWECEAGVVGTDTALDIQAGGSPSDLANNCLATDFSTNATMMTRATISLDDVTANYSANYGRFVVLYRGKVDAVTTSCTVRVSSRSITVGAVTPSPDITGVDFTVDNNATWRIYETGLIVQFPPSGTHTEINIPEQYGFTIQASRGSVAGELYSDCFILVPIDEYLIYCFPDYSGKVIGAFGEYVRTYFHSGPDGSKSQIILTSASSYTYSVDIPYTTGDGVPADSGDTAVWAYFLIFNTILKDNTLTNDANVAIRIFPRYHSLQGAE